ncbi:hypothetical protein REPUB_Repub09cG0193000 [Reevesia pubescens]
MAYITCVGAGADKTVIEWDDTADKMGQTRPSTGHLWGCHLHAVTNSYGALTAQKRESLLEVTGFSFVNCKVTESGALHLRRAWGDHHPQRMDCILWTASVQDLELILEGERAYSTGGKTVYFS